MAGVHADGGAQVGADVAGWTAVAAASFPYIDPGHTRMQVYQRRLKAGEEMQVPQGNWSGTLVLLPAGAR